MTIMTHYYVLDIKMKYYFLIILSKLNRVIKVDYFKVFGSDQIG